MKTKTVRDYIDRGCGFPVVFESVKLAHIQGEWVPLINYAQYERTVLKALCEKDSPLTGNQVRFIRLHFRMTLVEFGKLFGVTHPAVKKWEQTADKPTGMNWANEKNIRLYVFRRINAQPKPFVQLFDLLSEPAHGANKSIHLPATAIKRQTVFRGAYPATKPISGQYRSE